MEKNNLLRRGCLAQDILDNTLDDVQLDRLPVELIIDVLLQLDIPSLTWFRGLNRRAMQLVNSVRQYTTIINHCPNIIRAIVSIQADAFDCGTLYRTLCTTRWTSVVYPIGDT